MLPSRIKVKRNYCDPVGQQITIVLVDIHLSAAVEVSHPQPDTGRAVRLMTWLEIFVTPNVLY